MLLLVMAVAARAQEGNFAESDMLAGMKPGDRIALLAVHFGTTHDDTREKTIEAVNRELQKAFPDMDFREAWTSRIVMPRMKVRGVYRDTPYEALVKLADEGYTHVLIQSTNIIEGIEMESLRRDAAAVASRFKDIRVGKPLLYGPDEYRQVVKVLASELPSDREVLLVGHGTYTPATASYAMLDYMLKSEGHSNFHVGTIEGYPSFDDMVAQTKGSKALLVPLMFVAGDHYKNDIAEEWRDRLVQLGYDVECSPKGLGEYSGIVSIFVDRVRFSLKNKQLDIQEKKKAYAAAKD